MRLKDIRIGYKIWILVLVGLIGMAALGLTGYRAMSKASDDLDTTSVEALSELQDYLDARGQTLLLARVKDGPLAALQRAGSVLVDGPAAPPHAANSGAQAIIWEMYWSVDDAVTAGYNRLLQERSSSPVPQDHEAV